MPTVFIPFHQTKESILMQDKIGDITMKGLYKYLS